MSLLPPPGVGGDASSAAASSQPSTPLKHRLPQSFFETVPDPTDMKSLNLRPAEARSPRGSPRASPVPPPSTPGAASTVDSPIVPKESGHLEARPWTTSSQNRYLIKGGKIVNDDSMVDGDVYVEDGLIKQVGRDLIIPGGTKTIEAKGMLIMPGGIDANVHFQLPFMGTKSVDDFYQGTKAALAGGTTMIIDSVLEKTETSLLDSYEKWRSWADEKVCCDYGLTVAITTWNQDVRQDMEVLSREKGINAFCVSMAYKDSIMLRDDQLIGVFKACKHLGAVALVHAENGDIIYENERKLLSMGVTGPEGCIASRPEEVEAEATHRAVVLGNQVNCPVLIQRMTSKSAADVLAHKRKEGCIAYGECLVAALGTDGTHYFNPCWQHAAAHVTAPPLRPDPSTPGHLMDLLGSGNLQVVSSDHRTFTSSQKALGQEDFTRIPHGLNGVEDRMCVVWQKGVMSGKIDPCRFVAATSTNAAKIFNIYPRKGRIAVGSDADIVVWNPSLTKVIAAKTHQQAVDFNVFEGLECQGGPFHVVAQGRLVMEEGELHVGQGMGRFVPTPAFSPHVYACIQEREQTRIPALMNRESYEGPVVEPLPIGNGVVMPRHSIPDSPLTPSGGEFHARPTTRSGGRNLQDSTFSLSGAQIDDSKGSRSGIRVHNPPGGRSSGLW